MEDQVGVGEAGHPLDAPRFVALGVDAGFDALDPEELTDSLDGEAHHVAADVVRVVMRREDAGQAHAVGPCDLDELAHRVRGVYHQGLAGLPVADQVGEVDHLPGDRVLTREVATGEELAEVEALVAHALILRRSPHPLFGRIWSPWLR